MKSSSFEKRNPSNYTKCTESVNWSCTWDCSFSSLCETQHLKLNLVGMVRTVLNVDFTITKFKLCVRSYKAHLHLSYTWKCSKVVKDPPMKKIFKFFEWHVFNFRAKFRHSATSNCIYSIPLNNSVDFRFFSSACSSYFHNFNFGQEHGAR